MDIYQTFDHEIYDKILLVLNIQTYHLMPYPFRMTSEDAIRTTYNENAKD